MHRRNILFLGIVILLIIFLPGYSKLQELRAKNRKLNTEINALKEENEKLAREIDQLESDPFYIEKKARDKMGIGKEGEVRYKIIYEDEESKE